MLFGISEMKEFAENHDDHRVRLLWQRLEDSRNRMARQQSRIISLEMSAREKIKKLKRYDPTPTGGMSRCYNGQFVEYMDLLK